MGIDRSRRNPQVVDGDGRVFQIEGAVEFRSERGAARGEFHGRYAVGANLFGYRREDADVEGAVNVHVDGPVARETDGSANRHVAGRASTRPAVPSMPYLN